MLGDLKANHARLVHCGLIECKEHLEVAYLPQHSPEIKPDKYLNRDFKTEPRSSGRVPSKEIFLQKATRFMEYLVNT